MKDKHRANLETLEGRRFVLGREGHIYIDAPTASKLHAEIRIDNGRVYLRDLKSTNGTFLLKQNSLIPFQEGYVNPKQSIVIGREVYVIRDLLAIAGNFVSVDDDTKHADMSRKQHGRLTSASVDGK